jgi:hypothetical protein
MKLYQDQSNLQYFDETDYNKFVLNAFWKTLKELVLRL